MPKSYPPGLIGLACGEISRYSDFIPSLIALQKPPGTGFMKATGLGPANPFNAIGRAFMDNPEYEWLFLTNDDNLLPRDTIYRLLDRNVDVVGGLYFGRIQPFEPIMFESVSIVDGRKWYRRKLMEPGEAGLVPVVATGDGCLLIRRHVLAALEQPFWEYGETLTDVCDHDVVLSRKIREAGFGLYVDLDVKVDHIAQFAVRPYRDAKGEWTVQLVQGDRAIGLPVASREMVMGPVALPCHYWSYEPPYEAPCGECASCIMSKSGTPQASVAL